MSLFKNTEWQSPFILLVVLSVIMILVLTNKEKIQKTFLGVMYLLVTLTFLNQSLLNLSFGFFTLFLYRVALIAATLIFLILVIREKSLPDYWEQTGVKGILLFLFFWLAYGMFSLLWVKSLTDGIKYLFLLGTGILFVYLSVFSITKTVRLYWFYGIWMVMTIILLIIGMVNHFGHIQLASSTLYGDSEGYLGYPTAVFTNQNDFATFLSISTVFYFATTKNAKGPFLKIATFVLGALSVYTIYLTESRASLLGVLVALIGYGFIQLPSYLKKVISVMGAVISVGGIIVLHSKLSHFIQSKFAAASVIPVTGRMSSNSDRLNLLRNTFHYFLQTYGFGVGAGNLPYYLKNETIYYTDGVFEAHNWLGEIFGTFGLFIGLGYITMYVTLFYSLYKLYQKGSRHKVLLEAGMTGLMAFLISSISPSSVSNLYYHWVFLGFVIAMVSVFNKKAEQPDERIKETV